jgi:ribosomal protein S18 acetylase RimI-like enzyme
MTGLHTPELIQHLARVLPQICEGGTTLSLEQVLEIFEASQHFAVARVDGGIRAHAECRINPQAPHRWIVSCAVEPEYQGRGLGRQTLSEALAFADAHGAEYVDGTAWASNTRVLALDKSLGFVEVGKVEDAYRRDGVSYDHVMLVRKVV